MAVEESAEILLQDISQCNLSRGMWYLNVGASVHMKCEKDLIFDLDDSYKGRVRRWLKDLH